MKKWFKITLLIFLLLFIIALIIIAVTAIQIKQMVDLVKESESFNINLEALQKGDCSKLPEIELKYEESKTKIKYFCLNPIIKIGLEKLSPENLGFCKEINNPENVIEGNLTLVKKYCSIKN